MAKKLFTDAKTEAGLNAAMAAGELDAHVVFIKEAGKEGIYAKDKTYQTIPSNGKDGQVLISKDGIGVWMDINLLDQISYGVSWKHNVSDPVLTRVGNMNLHRTLPIQSGMKGCVYQPLNKKVAYWLDPNDWRLVESPITFTDKYPHLSNPRLEDSTLDANNLKVVLNFDGYSEDPSYLILAGRYVRVAANTSAIWQIRRIEKPSIDTHYKMNMVLTLEPEFADSFIEEAHLLINEWSKLELHSLLSGADGEVMVYVPGFYIRSWDDGKSCEVRISTIRPDSSWEYQPPVFISAYKDTIFTGTARIPSYLASLGLNNGAVSVVNSDPSFRGGNLSEEYDNPVNLEFTLASSTLRKPRTKLSRDQARAYERAAGKELLSYRQYKNIFYWLYVIEYANFDVQAPPEELSADGFHQGGLGVGVTNIIGWRAFNDENPITPIGVTNNLGNGTGTTSIAIPFPGNFQYPVRWRGFENPFGDTGILLDGVLMIPGSKEGRTVGLVYTTNNPDNYSDNSIRYMEFTGYEDGSREQQAYIAKFDLGTSANIIAKENGGSGTTYKCDAHAFGPGYSFNLPVVGGNAGTLDPAGLATWYNQMSTHANHLAGFRGVVVADN